VKGYLNKEIAEKLHISHNTVLTHRKNIISKQELKPCRDSLFMLSVKD
jgi:DNA-binding NarL/FixJ family response regulator